MSNYNKHRTYAVSGLHACPFVYKGSKTNFSDLPLMGNRIGDIWSIINKDEENGIRAGDNVSWNGTEWDILERIYVDEW